jgi:transglutaminase-like putative cysteine protease
MRKSLLLASLMLLVVSLGCQGEATPTPGVETRSTPPASLMQPSPEVESNPSILQVVEYDVEEVLTLANRGSGRPSKQNVWIALIRSVSPYQQVRLMEITPDDYRPVTDEYGNQYAEFDLADMPPGSETSIHIRYRIEVSGLAYDLSHCEEPVLPVQSAIDAEILGDDLQPELHIESNNVQIIDLANELAEGKDTACEKARAFYDYVGDNLIYTYNRADWGAQAALGEMGADCTEYASLMIALCRASGIPARYVEGLAVPGEETKDSARTEHAWLEVYLPGSGWVPMDPTMGRFPISREDYFARILPNHIIVTQGRNPSTLRGASYWTHIYWPGNSTEIRVEEFGWDIVPLNHQDLRNG